MLELLTIFEELSINSHGRNWDDDIRMYKGYDWEDYGKMMFENFVIKYQKC